MSANDLHTTTGSERNASLPRISSTANRIAWALQLVAAVILGQTLFFKFSGAPESVAIFEALGAEPYGRLGTAVAETIAVLLLLRRSTAALGGLLGMGLMSGALLSHLTKLGIEVAGDGGTLFALAIVTFLASFGVLVLRRAYLPLVGTRLAAQES